MEKKFQIRSCQKGEINFQRGMSHPWIDSTLHDGHPSGLKLHQKKRRKTHRVLFQHNELKPEYLLSFWPGVYAQIYARSKSLQGVFQFALVLYNKRRMERTFNIIMNYRKSLMKCGTQLMVGELGVSSYVASGRINVPGRGEDGSGTSDGSGSYIHRISIYMFRSIQRSDILVFSFWRGLFLSIYKSPKRKHKFLSLHLWL